MTSSRYSSPDFARWSLFGKSKVLYYNTRTKSYHCERSYFDLPPLNEKDQRKWEKQIFKDSELEHPTRQDLDTYEGEGRIIGIKSRIDDDGSVIRTPYVISHS